MKKVNEAKSQSKSQSKFASIRISRETQKRLDRVLALTNKKTMGRKIRADQVLSLAVELIAEEHIKMLQGRSLTNEDRMEALRQKFIETRGAISKDQWLGFAMTAELSVFLNEQEAGIAHRDCAVGITTMAG